jgi:hypothetical protein
MRRMSGDGSRDDIVSIWQQRGQRRGLVVNGTLFHRFSFNLKGLTTCLVFVVQVPSVHRCSGSIWQFGICGSTMSLIAKRRVESWHDGVVRMVK